MFYNGLYNLSKTRGLHEQVYLLSREFRRRGYDVYILYYRHGLINKNQALRIPLYFSGIHPNLYSSVSKCDYVIMETAWPWLATIPIHLMGKDFILHLHSIESLPEFGLPLHKRVMIKLAEEVAGRLARTIVTVSLTEYSILKTHFGNKVIYIPLAIDLEERKKYMNANKEDMRKLLSLPTNKLIIAFVGGMAYGANREAAKIIITQIAPKVHELTNGRVLFLLVGPDPPPESAGLNYIKVTGYVKSIAPYIVASDVCIAPVYHGAGVKIKVLDYMSLKKVVIATKKAVEGTLLKEIRDELRDREITILFLTSKNLVSSIGSKRGLKSLISSLQEKLIRNSMIKKLIIVYHEG